MYELMGRGQSCVTISQINQTNHLSIKDEFRYLEGLDIVNTVGAKYGGPTTMEVCGGRHNRRLIGVRIRRFSVEDLHNRLFLRYKIITEDPDRDLIRVPMIHCAFNCRHLMSRIEACSDVH